MAGRWSNIALQHTSQTSALPLMYSSVFLFRDLLVEEHFQCSMHKLDHEFYNRYPMLLFIRITIYSTSYTCYNFSNELWNGREC